MHKENKLRQQAQAEVFNAIKQRRYCVMPQEMKQCSNIAYSDQYRAYSDLYCTAYSGLVYYHLGYSSQVLYTKSTSKVWYTSNNIKSVGDITFDLLTLTTKITHKKETATKWDKVY